MTIKEMIEELQSRRAAYLNEVSSIDEIVLQLQNLRSDPVMPTNVFAVTHSVKPKRQMSEAARKAISKAQKARWARQKAG